MADLMSAMLSGDLLAEAELRYGIVAAALKPEFLDEGERPPTGAEIKALSIEADRLMHKIVSLRAERAAAKNLVAAGASEDSDKLGKVVAFDVDRFRKSG